ncbi:MAG: glycosyltransferase family 39 protein, partial [Myxococcales bacterium]|nr:glycosyltransferase family 39 protein [Myxococcales bacterium]
MNATLRTLFKGSGTWHDGPVPPPNMERRWSDLAWIAAIALLVRIVYLAFFSALPWFDAPRVDAYAYHAIAQRIAGGDWAPEGLSEGLSTLYVYTLGTLYALVGDSPWTSRAFHALLGMATSITIFLCAGRITRRPYALGAGIAYAVSGPVLFHEALILPETLGAFLHTLLLLFVLDVPRSNRSYGRPLAMGIVLGAAVLLRPSALLLALPCLVSLRTIRPALLFVAAASVSIAPATLRNRIIDGENILVVASG